MRVSTLIRITPIAIAVAAIAACSDAPVAPNQAQRSLLPTAGILASSASDSAKQAWKEVKEAAQDAAKALRDAQKKAHADKARKDGDANRDAGAAFQTAQVTFDPKVGVVAKFGPHSVVIPGSSVCDLATSDYGTGFWDLPCTLETDPVTITALWSVRGQHTYIEFEPALRFSPDTYVFLFLTDKRAEADPKHWSILWRDEHGGWIDESVTDPTLKTIQLPGGIFTRRIKHFSGYNISAGLME